MQVLPERDANGEPIWKFQPFSSNELPNGQLFARIHGVKASFAAGETKTLSFTVPYSSSMFAGVSIVYDVLCTTDMKTKDDTPTPNEIQYGFSVNSGKHVHTKEPGYVSLLSQNYVLEVSVTNHGAACDIGANFILHEII